MYKEKLFHSFLIGLPVAAVALSLTEDSVKVFDKQTQTVITQSYFDLLPTASMTMITAFAAMLTIIVAILAIAYVVTLKNWCAVGIFGTSFAAACIAVAPVLMHGDTIVVPNVLLPVLMLVVCLMAYSRMKKPAAQKEKQGERLEMRK